MLLFVVAFQIKFPWMDEPDPLLGSSLPRFKSEDWNARNVARRVKSALAYLDRQSHKFSHDRWSAERWHYLDGRRLLYDTFFGSAVERGPQLVPALPFASPTPLTRVFDPGLDLLRSWTRRRLVDELLRADPRLDDRELLMRLTTNKLAAMLDSAWRETALGPKRRA
jgi:hypothetical protein